MFYPETLSINTHYKWTFQEARQKNAELIKAYYDHINSKLEMHIHDFYEINIVTSGRGRHYIDKQNVPTEVGDVFVIPPEIPHGYHTDGTLTVFHVLLSNDFTVKYIQDLKTLKGFKMLFEIEPILRSNTESTFYLTLDKASFITCKKLMDTLQAEYTDVSHDANLRRTFTALSLIAILCDKMNLNSIISSFNISNKQTVSMIKSIENIENSYNTKLNFEEIATDCKISYSTYLRLFKQLTNTTPLKYQMSCRIKNAELMLKNSNETILSIALSTGFYDSAHFIREFKSVKGISPTEYRTLCKISN